MEISDGHPLVFISYAEEDAALAHELAQRLESAGFATWRYHEHSLPGTSYLTQIHCAISKAQALVVLLSISSIHSHQVCKELVTGHDLGKPLLPVRIGLSHEDVGSMNPDYQIMIGASVSLSMPLSAEAAVWDKLIRGMQQLVANALPDANQERQAPSAKETTPGGGSSSRWHGLAERLSTTHPEISRLQRRLERRWQQASSIVPENPTESAEAGERTRVADELCRDLVDVVSQEWHPAPRNCCLVARGGYGRGVLSLGSDIDLTLLHTDAERQAAEDFWREYVTSSIDCWNQITGIRMAPIILSVEDCRKSWLKALETNDLAPFVSFTNSRPVAGSEALHAKLREHWQHAVLELPQTLRQILINTLQERITRYTIDPGFRRFDTKFEAGGILEYRLAGFLEQMTDILASGNDRHKLTSSTSHHYLLRLREQTFQCNRTHILAEENFATVANKLFPGTSKDDQMDELIEETTSHRRKVRTSLVSMLDAASDLLLK